MKVEVPLTVLGSPSLIVLMVSVDGKQQLQNKLGEQKEHYSKNVQFLY